MPKTSQTQKANLKPVTRTVVLGGNPYQLRLDFGAMYAYEQLTGGRNLYAVLQQFSDDGPIYTATAQLLYALTASAREDAGHDEMSFKQFLRLLPSADPHEYHRLTQMAMEVVSGTLGPAPGAEDAAGNGPEPPQ